MKEPRPQDYDPTYKKSVKAEEFDVSELTPIAPIQSKPPSRTKKGKKSPTHPVKKNQNPGSSRPTQSTNPVNQSSRLTESINRPDQSTKSIDSISPLDPSTGDLAGEIVTRPPAFYIPKQIDQKIDEAVTYFQEKYHPKIDRSAVVSALLGEAKIWKKIELDKIAQRVMRQRKNRDMQRLLNRLG